MRYLIGSHVAYYRVTLPRLLNSMAILNAIPPEQITVVIGGAKTRAVNTLGGITYRFVEHNSFDHTPMIEALDAQLDDAHFFILHDTCEAGPAFRQLAENFDPSLEHQSADEVGWFNMGMFSRQYLEDISDFVLRMRDCGKPRAMMSEQLYARMALKWRPYRQGHQVDLGVENVYSDDVPRKKVHLPGVDLFKFLANHAQTRQRYFKP